MKIKATQICNSIKSLVAKVSVTTNLVFGPDDAGTHSIRTMFTTLLENKNEKIEDIMLVGQWKSTVVQKVH